MVCCVTQTGPRPAKQRGVCAHSRTKIHQKVSCFFSLARLQQWIYRWGLQILIILMRYCFSQLSAVKATDVLNFEFGLLCWKWKNSFSTSVNSGSGLIKQKAFRRVECHMSFLPAGGWQEKTQCSVEQKALFKASSGCRDLQVTIKVLRFSRKWFCYLQPFLLTSIF